MPVPGENPELDAQTRVPLLVGMSVAFLAISTIAVLLRMYTRYIVIKAPGSDDITIALAQVRSNIPNSCSAKCAMQDHKSTLPFSFADLARPS